LEQYHRSRPRRLSRWRAASSQSSKASAFRRSSSHSSTGFLRVYQLMIFLRGVRTTENMMRDRQPGREAYIHVGDGIHISYKWIYGGKRYKDEEDRGQARTLCQKLATSTMTLQTARTMPIIAEGVGRITSRSRSRGRGRGSGSRTTARCQSC
jgi:hypothetical protein